MKGPDQSTFRTALLQVGSAVPEGLIDGHGGAAGRRFAVYRNTVAVGLSEAVVEGFPTVARLIGAENLRRIAGLFLRQSPPDSPLMFRYGAAMPAFLTEFQPLAHLGYLPDAARLDLAMRASYHAADGIPVAADALALWADERFETARITLAPALRVLRSDWPLRDIWRCAQAEDAPPPRAQAQDVVVVRPAYDPEPLALPAGGAAFLEAIIAGASVAVAYEAATTETRDFDPTALLTLLLSAQAITCMETPR